MEPTVAQLVLKYLTWCKKNRARDSLNWYARLLSSFLVHLGQNRNMPISALRAYHVVEWVDSKDGWGGTYKRGAICAVQRLAVPICPQETPEGKERGVICANCKLCFE